MFVDPSQPPSPGRVTLATQEGSRPLLVEVQALVDRSPLSNPRRLTVGIEQTRLSMLLAVLHELLVADEPVEIEELDTTSKIHGRSVV